MNTNTTNKFGTGLQGWLILIAAVLLLGGGWIIMNQAQPSNQTAAAAIPPAPIKGHPAPEIRLETITGEVVALSDFKGKPVLVNFWATWCPPCRAEMPDLQSVYRENGDSMVILGVNATDQDNQANIAPFIEEFGLTFPIVLDGDGTAMDAYNIRGLPTSVFIDSNGIIQEVFTGGVNKAYVESKLAGL